MKKHEVVIAIDPDCVKSGVAELHISTRELILKNMTFPELMNRLMFLKSAQQRGAFPEFIVVVEAGWLVAKSNFHPWQGHMAEKIAKDVGANHETGRKIIEMCQQYFNIDVVQQHPLKKHWKGANGKITHAELSAFVPLKTKRTNQDERDAALIAWCYANLPIVISKRK